MEYTKDVIFNVKYNKKSNVLLNKFKKLKRIRQYVQKDNYFVLTIIISVLSLSIDYLIIRRFIEIVNLL